MKTRKKNKQQPWLGSELMVEQLRAELRQRISWQGLEPSRRLQALAGLLPVLEMEPLTFHEQWVQPLLDAGLSVEDAVACIAESHILPN